MICIGNPALMKNEAVLREKEGASVQHAGSRLAGRCPACRTSRPMPVADEPVLRFHAGHFVI